MITKKLQSQLEFIAEIDKLKTIIRRTKLISENRLENDAEHSWHLAIMAVTLEEYADEPVEISRVIKMLLIHDLVEIDAGDTFIYDEDMNLSKQERERQAAKRIFGLLPKDQENLFWNLWEEFEEEKTPEARFATALDRLQPIIHNYHNQGGTWKEFNITREQVEKKISKISKGSKKLWEVTEKILTESQEKGYL
ncbi:HD domain-containing protein [Natranaerobius trueperi]|uniref:Phosphohydrolase n=1 Tax=Natranaerobius trueperi TaxID=759412 RepID=A0A226BX54_9FIRM|nr:HD domain-containing protein [Natranaerobius trueperi]OWZ82904.1 phosphohydrolase [Natranaerobius trueperi]